MAATASQGIDFGTTGGGGGGGGGGAVNVTAPITGDGSLATPIGITAFAGAGAGAVPGTSGGDATKFLDGSGAFSTPAGGTFALLHETPAGTIDSSNLTFTIANNTEGQLQSNTGVLIGGGVNYTRTTTTIAFTAGQAPDPGDVLIWYHVG